jgi:SAM-dependent methyltransferase
LLTIYLRDVMDPQTMELFNIFKCNTCGIKQTFPKPSDLSRYYQPSYYGGRHGFTKRFCIHRKLRIINRFNRDLNDKVLLDVGCGDGSFLLAAKNQGFKVLGTEYNPSSAQSMGLDVKENIEDIPQQPIFDCISSWHSFEHLTNPKETLLSLLPLLKEKGTVFIAVPDSSGYQATIFGKNWFHLDVPRHLFHFDSVSLQNLLTSSGFVIKRKYHQEFEYDMMGWVQSFLNILMPTPNIFFSILTKKPTKASLFFKILNILLGILISFIAILPVFIGTLMGKGGTLIICASKSDHSVSKNGI